MENANEKICEQINQFKTFLQQIVEILENNKDKEPPKEYLTIKEMQEICHVTRATLYNWRKRGILKSYEIGGRRLFKTSEVHNAIENNQTFS